MFAILSATFATFSFLRIFRAKLVLGADTQARTLSYKAALAAVRFGTCQQILVGFLRPYLMEINSLIFMDR
jgi:hypothetical protein